MGTTGLERRRCLNPKCGFVFSARPASKRRYCVKECGDDHRRTLSRAKAREERETLAKWRANPDLYTPPATMRCYCGERYKAGSPGTRACFCSTKCEVQFIEGHYFDLGDYQRRHAEAAA